ncbi:solute carrier family 13 member 5 isoform X2 [Hyalella azteca]|nr:solute carrier family 13 member 5 isoform X2 [Hyalella azteca]
MKETNMMFLGGLTMAIAVEHSQLHIRIALLVLLYVGESPRRLLAGFMMTTMFLSMWISNTASTAMMLPIVDAILKELYSKKREDEIPTSEGDLEIIKKSSRSSSLSSTQRRSSVLAQTNSVDGTKQDKEDNDEEEELTKMGAQMRKTLLLAVAYSANIGGTGVVTGTTPNLILMANLEEFDETGLTFASWMGYNIPGMIICVAIAWIWLQILFMGCRKGAIQEATPEQRSAVRQILKKKYAALGDITFHESVVLTLFVILIFMWLFRSPEFVPGWAHWFVLAFGEIEVEDATAVMFIVLLVFIIPKKLDFWCFRDPKDTSPVVSYEGCLTWEVVQQKLPWGVVLLLGGGFAIAEAADASGLSLWLGDQLQALEVLPEALIVFLVCLMTAMVTEVASNTATASILMPVLKEMSLGIGINPLYLMLPATICCSYAFMLPVATPPNAIIFTAAKMKTVEMMKAGIMMNVICVVVQTLMINTLGQAMFGVRDFPDWANETVTSSAALHAL